MLPLGAWARRLQGALLPGLLVPLLFSLASPHSTQLTGELEGQAICCPPGVEDES